MPGERFIFLDFDDTISDPVRLLPQYVHEIGSILSPLFGGDTEDWAGHALETLSVLEREYSATFVGKPLAGYCKWLETIRIRSAEVLLGKMGKAVPAKANQLSIETQFNALLQCNALFPGADEVVHNLYEAGWRVQMASGQESEYLMAALMGSGIESYVESKFGPDLIDCAKEGPEYYERMFLACGISAADAIVVDDYIPALHWAMDTGATVIQTKLLNRREHATVKGAVAVISDIRELPKVLGMKAVF